jgi:tRNA pseudouridine38-40 synthase
MQTWRLDIEYDGTRYAGWQKQANARTVQGELTKAAEQAFETRVEIGGSGRTDSGVHALQQIAHLRLRTPKARLSNRSIQIELNDRLPYDINVRRVSEAPAKFHARHDAVARYYLYQISTRRTAFGKPYVWWIKDRLNLSAMSDAASLLVGRLDFASFTERDEKQKSTIVDLKSAYFYTAGDLVLFRIGASHFLWKMVRRLVGALAEVGRGKLSTSDFESFLERYSGMPAAWTAPPSGLFLERVLYAGDKPPESREPALWVGSD